MVAARAAAACDRALWCGGAAGCMLKLEMMLPSGLRAASPALPLGCRALDFDGVACDSVGESSLSAFKVRRAAERHVPSMPRHRAAAT